MQISKVVRFPKLPMLVVVLLLITTAGFAQQPDPSPDDDQPEPVASPTAQPVAAAPVAEVEPKVVSVIGDLELDDVVEVRLENLAEWGEKNDASKLVLYLNGRVIKGLYPEELHIAHGRLIYHLEITKENKEVWIDLLGAPSLIKRPVTLSVGLENGSAFDSVHAKENPVVLTVISPLYGIVALIVIAATLILLLWLATRTNIIREPGPPAAAGKKRPYNLGRAQMAFWFFLIYASYMAIWLITGALDTITASLLALMGISAGTALGEAMIDNGKDTAKTNQIQDLIAEKQAIEQGISETQSDVDTINASPATASDQTNRDVANRQLVDSRTRLGQIDQQLRTINSQSSPAVSGGFLRDILSDGSGYSFHRFQIFAWTIVLGIIFVSSVYNNLTMPEFSTTLLGLMGLSAGTYIGFRFPEQK